MTRVPDGPFRVGAALEMGITRERLRAPDLVAPFHGVRIPAGIPLDVPTLARSYMVKMRREAAFTSITAAILWGMPLPAFASHGPLHVSVPRGIPRPRGRGVRGHEHHGRTEVVVAAGYRMLSARDTWFSLASVLDVPDLVAAADFLVSDGTGVAPLASIEALLARSLELPGPPGIARAREALSLVRVGSLSRPESLTRVLLVSGGVTEPRLNLPLPGLGAMLDLAWPDVRFGLEYEGDHHREPQQFGRDLARRERIRDAGWDLMHATRFDLFDAPLALLDRVRLRLGRLGMQSGAFNASKIVLPRR